MPASIASLGLPSWRVLPSSSTSPVSARSAPNKSLTVSVRPAPTNPVRARISPALTSSETFRTFCPRFKFLALNRTAPGVLTSLGNSFSNFRPTIISIILARSNSSLPNSPTRAPSLITIARSATRSISSNRWLT